MTLIVGHSRGIVGFKKNIVGLNGKRGVVPNTTMEEAQPQKQDVVEESNEEPVAISGAGLSKKQKKFNRFISLKL